MKTLELTQDQADEVGTPFTCDACEAWVNRGDRWGTISMPHPAAKGLKVMLLCEPCTDKLMDILREFFRLPAPAAAEAADKE